MRVIQKERPSARQPEGVVLWMQHEHHTPAPFYAEKPTPTRVVAVRTLKEAERGSAWRHQPLSMACETPLSTSITVESKAMSPFV